MGDELDQKFPPMGHIAFPQGKYGPMKKGGWNFKKEITISETSSTQLFPQVSEKTSFLTAKIRRLILKPYNRIQFSNNLKLAPPLLLPKLPRDQIFR